MITVFVKFLLFFIAAPISESWRITAFPKPTSAILPANLPFVAEMLSANFTKPLPKFFIFLAEESANSAARGIIPLFTFFTALPKRETVLFTAEEQIYVTSEPMSTIADSTLIFFLSRPAAFSACFAAFG